MCRKTKSPLTLTAPAGLSVQMFLASSHTAAGSYGDDGYDDAPAAVS